MRAAADKLNSYAGAFEDAQSDIREIVKNAYLRRESKESTRNKILAVIVNATKSVKIRTLKADARKSLWAFAEKQRLEWQRFNMSPELLLFLGLSGKGKASRQVNSELERIPEVPSRAMGVPLRRYYKEVWEKLVKPFMDKMIKLTALDPNDYTGRNSLRNLAEMEVRYRAHQDDIRDLKERGVKLVVCSSHADCSDRCAEWQGRIYSLDGTRGIVDGHAYVPLEEATDHFYTTKAGRTYKNGLLGFNCRHKIYEYKSELLPVISAEARKAEYAITKGQRKLEWMVRKKRTEALMLKNINNQGYVSAKASADALYQRYMQYCKKNGRAYYPMRTAI